MKTLLTPVWDLLFPSVRCLACDDPRNTQKGAALCPSCSAALPALHLPDNACGFCRGPRAQALPCPHCASGGMERLDGAYAPFLYEGVARQLILRLKFGPCLLAAKPLCQAMARQMQGLAFDVLVPVPLYRSRQRERGMNQSQVLANGISRITGHQVLDALKKTRQTKRQSSLKGRQQREKNVANAFSTTLPVAGLRLVLVDDVRTSGATARDSARALKQAGASSVFLLTAAVAWPGKEHHG